MKKLVLGGSLVLWATAVFSQVQEWDSKVNPVWDRKVGTAQVTIAVNSISTVVLNQSKVQKNEGLFEVTELNIETVGGNNLRIYFEKPEKEKQTTNSDETLSIGGTPISVEELQKKAKEMLSKEPQASSETPYAVGPKQRDERGIYAKIIEVQAVSEQQVREIHQELLQKWLRQN